ncbi:TPA: hemin uptake protein HemP [Providencia stuartii]|uniref:Hemin uptake protein HemP n=3 Tax=Providencia stuartii TaxID=588 RepID=A0AAJ1JN27_PROST|nr:MULTISPECIES: hemin uptake protein HemP [Providencia]SST02996.1 Hemin uptake protein [Acinetobacter baumannii]AFH95686.1 hemin uptake protein HemP [Providencia stuartii MRSN 2154]AIN64062.1 hemin uptake hemP family protein [Providencia stuartii]AMG66209.1 hemin uptake protein HemP [Providencia stuartii]APG49692.1 hemin transporter HemP [Providencia stuartii]
MTDNITKPPIENIANSTLPPVKVDVIDSHQLLGSEGKLAIQHRGEIYQLRQTRAGKLILTK